jgi:predicted chitinase
VPETDLDLCVDVAGWFWAKRQLNRLADTDDLLGITKRIKRGSNGLEDRRRLLKRAKGIVTFLPIERK